MPVETALRIGFQASLPHNIGVWSHVSTQDCQISSGERRVSNCHGFRGQIEDIKPRRRKNQKANVKTTNELLDPFSVAISAFLSQSPFPGA